MTTDSTLIEDHRQDRTTVTDLTTAVRRSVTTGGRLSASEAGVLGGLVASLVLSAFRVPTAKSLPPTADFLADVLGGSASDYPVAAFALHLSYGVAAGVAYAHAWVRRPDGVDDAETAGLVLGGLYGAALSVVGERVVVPRAVGIDLETDDRIVFHVSHVLYGLTLGAWVESESEA